MSRELLMSLRMFQVWDYTIGHKQLLLRSTKGNPSDNRIDVYFKDVGAICLPTVLNGLKISEAGDVDRSVLLSKMTNETVNGRKLYLIESSAFQGYLLAGMIAWHEDDGAYDDPSYFKLRDY